MTVKTAETTEKTTRLPRRRRDFQGLSEETIGAIVRRAIGPNTQAGRIVFPDQGINNQTYLVARNDGPDLVIKVRHAFPLICIDQNPTHYLNDGDGGLAAMIDVEGHLWGPREWELATVELWLQNGSAFRKAYTSRHAWPPAMEAVRPAYQFYTWMEWIYCNDTLLHDEAGAAALERHLVEQSESVFSAL